MVICLSLLLCAALFTHRLTIRKTRAVVRELEESVRMKRRLLLNEPSALLRRIGMEPLVSETNKLIDQHRSYTDEVFGQSTRLDAMLGSTQEAVIIFNDQRVVEFLNESAKRLFQGNRALKGARLESVLRSSSLLDFLDGYREDHRITQQEISVDREGGVLWFEASCAEVRDVSAKNAVSTLLVLHDITRLKSLEMVRRDFVANVSHELRTPLTIIKGFAETLEEDHATLTAETRSRFIEKIVNNAKRLHVLVEDLLELSRLESKSDQVQPTEQSLLQLMDEILEDNRQRLDTNVQSMELDFDERVGEFAFDRFRIQQVFDNLIENAFRYAPDFTRLVLSVRYEDAQNMVHCCVADDGPGIPEKDVPHIFERFYRVDKGRSRENGGTGLGLSIIKHIVQQHGGSVSLETGEAQGTAIHFTLPYVQSAQSE
ncbi:ATP-binding protein [Opitutales bacterium]|nr:ATP-binding protein [Opitutales bacterium]